MPVTSVPAGATSVLVPGGFTLPYQLALSPSWATTIPVVSKTATGFTVFFTVASPGGTLGWVVVGPGGTLPSTSGILLANTVSITDGSASVVITGNFGFPYEVMISTSWATDAPVVDKQPQQFTVAFTVAAPPSATLDYTIIVPVAPVIPGTQGMLAGEIITNIRDEIPDPVYDDNGIPLPDQNGSIVRASTLYGWLDDGVRIMARICGAIVTDWTAIAQRQNQPWYAVNTRFRTVTDAFSLQWPLEIYTLGEGDVIWPSTSQAAGQSLWGYIRKQTDHLEFGEWPIPQATDPSTVLVNDLSITGDPAVILTDPTNFLSFGYVQIDAEILQYQLLSGSSLTVLSRGVCGTSAAPHAAGATVQQLGLWLKGTRSPAQIVNSTSLVELPLDIVSEVKTYVMSRVRGMENEFEEAARLRKRFDEVCMSIRADPTRKEQIGLIPSYLSPKVGPIYFPGGGGVIVPALAMVLLPLLGLFS